MSERLHLESGSAGERQVAEPPSTAPGLVDALRGDLEASGFTVAGLTALWGENADAALFRGHRVPALRKLEGEHSALAVLASLFVLGTPTTSEQAAAALPRLGLEGAMALGLLREGDGLALPQFDLRPYAFTDRHGEGQWWVLSDLGELALGGPIDEAHVLGIGGASATLASFAVQEPARTVLDLGTGCGIQAMHASRHAERVIATDISSRALAIAAFNAALNRIEGIEFRLGSLYEPVAGERFDRIVSNPPFVITPRSGQVPEYEYRDGGMEGDAIVEAVIRGAAELLHPGGIAQFLGNWEYRRNGHAHDRLRSWLADTGLDAWIVEREVQDAASYAETWIRDGGTRPGARFDQLERAWLDDFERREVQQIGFGYIALHRVALQSGSSRMHRIERVQHELPPGGLADHVFAALTMAERLATLSDGELAMLPLTVAADVTEERHLRPGDDDPTAMLLRQGGGLARAAPVDTALAAMVGACDGELPPAAIAAAIGELLEVDPAAVLAATMPQLRELLFTGFLSIA